MASNTLAPYSHFADSNCHRVSIHDTWHAWNVVAALSLTRASGDREPDLKPPRKPILTGLQRSTMMSDSSVPDSTPQGTNCPAFNPPPLDGSYTVPELFDDNAKRNPEHPLFVFADGERKTRTICFAEAWRMIRRTARNIQGRYKDLQNSNDVQETNKPLGHGRVIGILAVGGLCVATGCN